MPKREAVNELIAESTRTAILETIRGTAEPVTAAGIAKLFTPPPKLTEKKLAPVLDEFVAAGSLHLIPSATAKGKPRYWDRDLTAVLRAAVVDGIRQATEPLTSKELASQIKSPVKASESDVATILDGQVVSGVVRSIPPKSSAGKQRYWHGDLQEYIGGMALQVVNSKGPQSETKLKSALKGINAEQFQQSFQRLLSDHKLYEHPPTGKKGPSLFGSQPPRPEPYLEDLGTMLTQVVSKLRSAQVPIDAVRRALVQLIETAGIPFGPNSSPPSHAARNSVSSDGVDLGSLMCQVEPAAEAGALVSSRTLRRAAEMSKQEFDRAVLKMAAEGRVSLHRHDYVASLTDAEREELVTDGHGAYYVGLALRR